MDTPPQRVRSNANARGSVTGGSSHKKRQVNNRNGSDAGFVEVTPKSVGEKAMEWVERMRQEVSAWEQERRSADDLVVA